MSEFRPKFDPELRDIYTSWRDLQRGNQERVYPHHSAALGGGPLSLRLQFTGDLAAIEARGFRTEWVEGDLARGDVELEDLEAVASHPSVLQLEYGSAPRLMLETSAMEIRARGQIWTVNTSTGVFTGHRGAGVAIGVIDTGIDIHHAVFLKPGSNDTTRIRRIWDMGVAPHDGIPSPDVALLQGNVTYGVEYTDAHINEVLRKRLQKKKPTKPVKHRDCHGHGTHVAAIAAGDGRAVRAKAKYQFVGVAPEADLIIVKVLMLQTEPAGVNEERRFEDAVTYIERVAKQLKARPQDPDPPVVVNASLGWNTGPHDGLEVRDRWLQNRFQGASGKAFIAAAGNEANGRQHGLIVIPAAGQVDVPFTLYDERHVDHDRSRCKPLPNALPELKIELWYRPPAAGALTSRLQTPGGGTTNGPALGATVSATYHKKRAFSISHSADTAPRGQGSVTRHVLRIKFTVSNNSYGTGAFTLRLSGTAGTEIHAWCDQTFPDLGLRIGHDNKPLPAGITVPNASTVLSPSSSAGAVSVANYDDTTGNINASSSNGPLADYSTQGPIRDKPDVSAPGTDITAASAANSFMAQVATLIPNQLGGAYAFWSGTSAASPHVAGVAALMFEKKPNLALTTLVQQLEGKARSQAPKSEFGEGKVDAKATRDAV